MVVGECVHSSLILSCVLRLLWPNSSQVQSGRGAVERAHPGYEGVLRSLGGRRSAADHDKTRGANRGKTTSGLTWTTDL
jgi:hypothetical protein